MGQSTQHRQQLDTGQQRNHARPDRHQGEQRRIKTIGGNENEPSEANTGSGKITELNGTGTLAGSKNWEWTI
jgi:hypothetical protein